MRSTPTAAAFLTLAWLAALPLSATAAEPVDYLRDIKPVLKARCYACHGALQQKSKLRLDTAALIRKGGRQGPAVEPGNSRESLLIDAVTGNGRRRMPPEGEGEALSEKQVTLLRAWIDQGAKGPADEQPEEDPNKHWAFQRPVRSVLPAVKNPGWVRNPIDAFVAAEHERRSLAPTPPAAKHTLLRRVYLDLIGLPPTREELHGFLADPSPDAYEKVVDRLLASPQYGERWARHWMDVWRYSDWYGRRAVPDVWNSAPQIWRWRDWIVQSLNTDKGYDRMVMEMLAADEIAPGDDEAVVATGYLVRNWYALNAHQWMRDNVEHTGKAFLGLTLNCCHCHDHKYDPITQEEYFKFRAFFEPLELRQDRVPGEADPGPFQKYEYSVLRKVVQTGSIRVFDEKLDAKTYMYRGGDERVRFANRPPVEPGPPAFLGGNKVKVEPVELPVTAHFPGLKPFIRQEELTKAVMAVEPAQKELEQAKRELAGPAAKRAELKKMIDPNKPLPKSLADALVTAELEFTACQRAFDLSEAKLEAAKARLAALRARIAADDARYANGPGDPQVLARAASKAERLANLWAAKEKLFATVKARGLRENGVNEDTVKKAEQQVTAAEKALAADSDKYTHLSPVYPSRSTGRRRALARWIAGRDNPLTARVAVNHVWRWHIDRPLVESVFDFGRNGKRPTHPELLDWLAVEFMDSGWSLKHLHRLIVTSNTYRMQSAAPSDNPNWARDTDNRYLWRFPQRRMEAEVVRDSLLHVAGQLAPVVGGPVIENNLATTSRRRSLYFSVYPEDGGSARFLEMFDAPDPCDCYRRSESIVPQQALALTNSELLLDMSRLLARELCREVSLGQGAADLGDSAFVVAAFEQVLSRRPTEQEATACKEFLEKQRGLIRGVKLPAAKRGGRVPASPEPGQRARESLARALLNHDDFLTVR